MGRWTMPADQAAEIQDRLKWYLKFRYGSVQRFKRRVRQHGWFKPDTIDRWFKGTQLPDAGTMRDLLRFTGLDLNWLMSSVGWPSNPMAQLGLSARLYEDRPPIERFEDGKMETTEGRNPNKFGPGVVGDEQFAVRKPVSMPVYHHSLGDTYREAQCRFCGTVFRQELEDHRNPNSQWVPPCCHACWLDRIEIPKREEELAQRRSRKIGDNCDRFANLSHGREIGWRRGRTFTAWVAG
jgi:hypothetical protein